MPAKKKKLKKSLGLFDVFTISTGPMFSSGFFLLPGLAYAETGPSVFLAYLFAGLLFLPSLLSKAELATAMPRAGGTYYFIDRALGPLAGTIGGIGTWISLVLKSAFALIGIGTYLAVFVDVPVIPVAVSLTIAFGIINYFGVKEAARFQNILVSVILSVLGFYIIQGLLEVYSLDFMEVHQQQFKNFFKHGIGGFLGTAGMVFVSFAGVTKVASVAEEVKNPDKNIPLGMLGSLAVTMCFYLLGVYLMVALLPGNELSKDLTPVATSAQAFFDWLPQNLGVIIIVSVAIVAFVSAGNVGIMSASRYPLAMARDRLLPVPFASISRFKTPAISIICTVGLMISFIVFLNVAQVAKLASTFKLLIFAITNLVLIVMRESRIWSYTPGFRTPLYPWVQLFGIIGSIVLIVEIGMQSVLFTVGLIILCFIWYRWYVKRGVEREGAIFHLFARLGKYRFDGLDHELKEIMMERELHEEDPYEAMLINAKVKDVKSKVDFETILDEVTKELSSHSSYSQKQLKEIFLHGQHIGGVSLTHGAAIIEVRLSQIEEVGLYLIRFQKGMKLELEDVAMEGVHSEEPVYALVFLISPQSDSGQHLRMLSELVSRIEEEEFIKEWRATDDEQGLREVFMRHERFVDIKLKKGQASEVYIGLPLKDVKLPGKTLIAAIRREGEIKVPYAGEVLKEGDRIRIIGEQKSISKLYDRYVEKR